jgi:hypothetical protein
MTDLKLNGSNRSMGRRAFEPEHDTLIQERLSLLNTGDLARITRTSKSTWEKMRVDRLGPSYIKVRNLVWYRRADVAEWLSAHEVQTLQFPKIESKKQQSGRT